MCLKDRARILPFAGKVVKADWQGPLFSSPGGPCLIIGDNQVDLIWISILLPPFGYAAGAVCGAYP